MPGTRVLGHITTAARTQLGVAAPVLASGRQRRHDHGPAAYRISAAAKRIKAGMSAVADLKNECYELAHKHVLCIEFVLSDTERLGFHTGQLLVGVSSAYSNKPAWLNRDVIGCADRQTAARAWPASLRDRWSRASPAF